MKPQCLDLLAALRQRPMTTYAIQRELGIGRPASRVDELRQAGCDIETIPTKVTTRRGRAVVAKYRLNGVPASLRKEVKGRAA